MAYHWGNWHKASRPFKTRAALHKAVEKGRSIAVIRVDKDTDDEEFITEDGDYIIYATNDEYEQPSRATVVNGIIERIRAY